MTTLTRSRGTVGGAAQAPALIALNRRSVPLAAAGVLLVVVCALAFADGWARAGHRQPVLALARPVAAGQLITAADLQVVRVSAAGPVSLIPASAQDQVAGSTAAASMPAGTLLAGGDIGAPPPAAGQAELGVAVKPGQYPPGLSPGQDVDVLATPAPAGSGSPGVTAAAVPAGQGVVVSVSPAQVLAATGPTVVELQLPRDALAKVAAAAATGQISLAAIRAGG